MKANELMIKDNVFHFNERKNCVITGLSEHKILVSFTDDNGNTKYSELLPEMAFGPIPITAEILEKNFLVQRGEWTQELYFFSNNYIEIFIRAYADGIWGVVINDVEMSGLPSLRMCVYISYVHQLQHALRLCNINKEIEIC